MRVLIHVQHLLGIGHLHRAASLANALAARGFSVLLVSGGRRCELNLASTVELAQLAPLYSADSSFTRLLDADGLPIDDRWRNARRDRLLELYRRFSPQALITETFPFGRRMLRFELLPLLQIAADDPACRLCLASVRDVLQPKTKSGRNDEIVALIEKYYDRVLVHGDPGLLRLDDSFAASARIADRLHYSGYITAAPAPAKGEGAGEVVVSAGGSNTGLDILRSAIAARPLTSLDTLPWRILVSPAIAGPEFEKLTALAGDGIRVERNRADFAGLLCRARLSVSQAGYNTVGNILQSGVKAVLIPFAEAGEVEQTIRAQRLGQALGMVVVDPAELSPSILAAAIDAADRGTPTHALDLDGANRSADLIHGWLQEARA